MEEMNWHSYDTKAVVEALKTSEDGLKSSEASYRFHKYGPNAINGKKEISRLRLLLNQLNSFIIWILIAATILSVLIGELIDAAVILVIIILNAVLGYVQEYKAERSIEALKKISALKAVVIRSGKKMRINAEMIVKGDIILLESGNKVPADARIIDSERLELNESSLTGESTPVKKTGKTCKSCTVIADMINMVFSGTVVTKGKATAVVVETGMKTELGRIAGMIQETEDEETPLQKKLSVFGEFMGIGILIISAIIFIIGIAKGTSTIFDTFMISISLAVAAIPEGLPAVVTICLAIGVQRMIKKNTLIRKLPSVETLGETDIICTDKTGTLTHNQMTVREVFANNSLYHVSGHGYQPTGEFTDSNNKSVKKGCLERLLRCAVLCNDAKLERTHKGWEIFGDPTEGALIVAARKAGIDAEDTEKDAARIDSIPFDSKRKRMTTIHKENRRLYAYTKGAPDELIRRCTHILINGRVRRITENDKSLLNNSVMAMAEKALRVLGLAYKEIKGNPNTGRLGGQTLNERNAETGLVFLGLAGMYDPPRREVIQSIRRCMSAGIKIVVITGDHKATAVAVARELGLGTTVMTGEEIKDADGLNKVIQDVDIFARVSPEHKLMIVKALQKKGHIVAMTGDGVNDAPALKSSDIGVAMGITGTDVSKEAADMILTDDNFTSIVNAVEEGRRIYDNIRKFVRYLITSNTGEVMTLFAAMVIGYTSIRTGNLILPLLAIHLLLINLLTDGFPALALCIEKQERDVMKRKPRKKNEAIANRQFIIDTVFTGLIMCVGTLFVFQKSLHVSDFYAQTMAFTTLVMFQLFNVFNCRSDSESVFSRKLFTNRWLWIAVGFSVVLQLALLYTPLSRFAKTIALGISDWPTIIITSFTVVAFYEIKKLLQRISDSNKKSAGLER
ncbi:calcium-translocating P-type ATPase, SERCA-type [Candidatus Woesearchaeota archaeon]|nr:calcium-translocating P-type ATPase, SERCA-type [Candidatus Woesearchaeota archaeon]